LTIERFIAYHVQDNGIYIGQKGVEGVFETSLVNLETNQFYGLHVEEDPASSTLEVYPKGDTSQKVEVDPTKCNLMATQNFYIESIGNSSSEKLALGQIYSSSYVVMHQIKDNKDFSLPAEVNPWDQSMYDRMKAIFDRYGVTLPDPVQN